MRWVVSSILLVGCSAAPEVRTAEPSADASATMTQPAPSPSSEATPEVAGFGDPPEVTIHGVAGDPVSWCWRIGCADGVYVGPVEDLPALPAPPEEAVSSEPAVIVAAAVFAADDTQASVPFEGLSIGSIPAGTWERLQLTVQFLEGGDATYLWRLVD